MRVLVVELEKLIKSLLSKSGSINRLRLLDVITTLTDQGLTLYLDVVNKNQWLTKT